MMSLVLYVVVLLISVSSVLFGLGWLSTPAPQYKASTMQVSQATPVPKPAARIVLKPLNPVAPAKSAKVVTPVESVKDAKDSSVPPSQVVAGKGDEGPVTSNATTGTGPGGAVRSTQAAPSPACDIQACSVAYRSFRVSDCTYQPYNGPRRLCTKGTPPDQVKAKQATPALASNADAQADAARAQVPSCNVAACEAAYKTFDSSDCTYQPFNGPRRLCTK